MNGYTLDFTAGALPQQVNFTLPRHLFTHLGFPSVLVALSVTFIPGFVMIVANDIWLTDNGWRTIISFLILQYGNIKRNGAEWPTIIYLYKKLKQRILNMLLKVRV